MDWSGLVKGRTRPRGGGSRGEGGHDEEVKRMRSRRYEGRKRTTPAEGFVPQQKGAYPGK